MAADSELRSIGWATSDLLFAAAGLAIVCYPGIAVGNSLLGSPASESTVNLAVGVLAVGGSYPFVAGDWSYGALEDFVLAFAASALAVGAAAMAVIVALGLDIAGSNPVPQAATLAVAYGVAYRFVLRR